ncbi:MAG TPA: hypothetical protein DEA08_30385 [Planctomycetes bacterium]|nr:hypothetical protein [Planctomycetota bacterium]
MSRRLLLSLALLVGAFVLFFSPSEARADKVVLVNGGAVRGTVVEETRRYVKVKKKSGMVITIRRDEIDRVEKTDWKKVLQEREAKLKRDDLDGRYQLAVFCKDHALDQDAERLCKEVIARDTNHEDARRFLGYRQVKGEWLRGDALKRALGLVLYKGKWITPEEQGRLEAERAARVAEKARARKRPVPASAGRSEAGALPRPALPQAEEDLLKAVRGSGSVERREEAARALSAKGGAAQQALRDALNEELSQARAKVSKHFERSKGKIRAKLARKIVTLRQKALGIIFDKSIYPDANHGASGQPVVDKAVGELIRAYDHPLESLRDDDKLVGLLAEVERLAAWAQRYGGSESTYAQIEAELAAEAKQSIDMRRFPVDGTDAKVLRQSQEILLYNQKKKSSATEQERACIRATNEYRMLFGLRALKLHEPLMRAARGHSNDMEQRRFFDHMSPVPGKRSPGDRCKAEGASYAGENIAMGMNTGRGAFNAWYTSSGHHRNMLMKGHVSIGIGNSQSGRYWTQNFGYDNPK